MGESEKAASMDQRFEFALEGTWKVDANGEGDGAGAASGAMVVHKGEGLVEEGFT